MQLMTLAVLAVLVYSVASIETRIQKYYEELGCKQNGNDESYDCSVLDTLNPSKCYVFGIEYNIQDTLTSEETRNPCIPACTCTSYDGEKATLSCAHNDCPEFFNPPIHPGCMLKHDPSHCCSVGQLCGITIDNAASNSVATCTFNGKTYLEGQYIQHDLPCKTCVCQSGFDGSLDGPWCVDVNCPVGRQDIETQKTCAPVFYGSSTCCPIEWRCPSSEDTVIRLKSPEEDSETKQCKFGNLTLVRGETLNSIKSCVECACSVPPFVTCVQKSHLECESMK